MKKNSVLRKVLAVALSAVTLLGTGFTTVGQFISTGVSVSAADILTYGDFQYEVNSDDTVKITGYRGNGGNVVIPDTINGKCVTSIINWLFSGCTNLTNIIIGKNLIEIGDYAFYRCSGLANINVDVNNVRYSSSNGVLFDKAKRKILIYPQGKQEKTYTIPDGVTDIGEYAFMDCSSLSNIIFPDSVTRIGNSAFFKSGLIDINIPDSVTTVGAAAFDSCYNLVSVSIPNAKEISSYLFVRCSNLKNVKLSDGIQVIQAHAFEKCSSLTNITVPKNVYFIGYEAFKNCYKLQQIVIPTKVIYIDYTAFDDCYNLVIYGKSGDYAETYANEKNISFVSEYTNVSTISENEIVIGGTVMVNAKALLGDGDYTYSVLYKKTTENKWTTKQNFSTNDTVAIKPAYATDYDICVKVKDGSGKIVKKYFELKVNPKLANTSTLSAENITLGQQITVNGLAQGGMGEYQYQVVYKQTAQTAWTTAQNFSENATVTFKPAKTTTYDVCVKVKDSNGTIVKKFFTVQVNAKLTNTSDVSATEIKKGSTVTVNGSATGGVGDYTYAVYYKQKAQTKWTVKQDFNENSDVSVKPAQATDYDICVKVKDKDGTIVKKYFTVTVTK